MLKLRAIDAYYGYIHALKDFSIDIPEGKVVTLLGANGAGKTTALKVISGLLKPKHGNISFQKQEITHLVPEQVVAKGIVQCPEGRQVFHEFTVLENLKIGTYTRKDRGKIEAELQRVFEYFPVLRQRQLQLAGTLSGGEQQMLAIARALMAKPKLLLMDEPSLGLAPIIVQTIFEIIKAINKEGTTILLVEQNAYQALAIADYAYIMETGKIILHGNAEEIKNDQRVKAAYLGGH